MAATSKISYIVLHARNLKLDVFFSRKPKWHDDRLNIDMLNILSAAILNFINFRSILINWTSKKKTGNDIFASTGCWIWALFVSYANGAPINFRNFFERQTNSSNIILYRTNLVIYFVPWWKGAGGRALISFLFSILQFPWHLWWILALMWPTTKNCCCHHIWSQQRFIWLSL